MNEQQRFIFSELKQNWLYGTILVLTLAFFIYKGVSYFVTGSYVPMVFILSILALFFFGTYKSKTIFIRILGLWTILIIIWASVRLLLGLLDQFVKPVPEGHVSGQLGIAGILFSIAFLVCGIYLWKFKKSVLGKP